MGKKVRNVSGVKKQKRRQARRWSGVKKQTGHIGTRILGEKGRNRFGSSQETERPVVNEPDKERFAGQQPSIRRAETG